MVLVKDSELVIKPNFFLPQIAQMPQINAFARFIWSKKICEISEICGRKKESIIWT
jgi:hypothetical protein